MIQLDIYYAIIVRQLQFFLLQSVDFWNNALKFTYTHLCLQKNLCSLSHDIIGKGDGKRTRKRKKTRKHGREEGKRKRRGQKGSPFLAHPL